MGVTLGAGRFGDERKSGEIIVSLLGWFVNEMARTRTNDPIAPHPVFAILVALQSLLCAHMHVA